MKLEGQLRGDPQKRRRGLAWVLFLALVAFAVSVVDILLLDEAYKLAVFATYAVLFVVGVLLLISRRMRKSERRTEVLDMRCAHCGSGFRANLSVPQPAEAAMSCPICGIYSRMPSPGSTPVAMELGEAPAKSTAYRCMHCNERLVIGTFGNSRHHEVLFQGCPHCGKEGWIRRQGEEAGTPYEAPPTASGPPQGA
jgi:Zn finger protein HypA/HybF involved in hydrogenase expression